MPTIDDPGAILGVGPEAAAKEIRAAYLRKVKEHPPERDPEAFERVRDAYDLLRDPRRRIRDLLFGGDPLAPFDHLLENHRAERRFAGPKPWIAALREG